jgi:hypothetical protein
MVCEHLQLLGKAPSWCESVVNLVREAPVMKDVNAIWPGFSPNRLWQGDSDSDSLGWM